MNYPKLLRPTHAGGLFLAGLAGATALHASDLVGRAADAKTGTYLSGVLVRVDDSQLTAITDDEGRYTIANVPPGQHRVTGQHIGYEAATAMVDVGRATASADLAFGSDLVTMQAMMVEGYREGRSKAIQQKRTAENVMDIVSADAIGNLPDRNVAEAVARLPGVDLSLEQGEGRYVSIRGVEPNLNQVMLDGATMAAPGGTRLGRAVPLDTLGSGLISQIQVIKSTTPDLDANALGGTLNIKTASPFDRKDRFIGGSLALGYNETTKDYDPEAKINFSDTFAHRRWGLAAGASYDRRHYSNNWLQVGGWNLRTFPAQGDVWLPSSLEVKPEWGELARAGGNLALEFRPSENTQFYLRPTYTRTARQEHTIEIIQSVDNGTTRTTLTSPTTGTFNANTRTERRDADSLKVQKLFSVAGGLKQIVGPFTIEPMATFSSAREDTPYNRVLAFRNNSGGTGPVQFDIGSFEFNRWDVDPAIDLPTKYTLRRTRDDGGVVDEDTLTAKIDVRWDSAEIFHHPGYLKTGFKYLQRDRTTDLESARLVPVGSWNLGAIGVLPEVSVYGSRYRSGFLLNPDATWNYIRANPALTTPDLVDSTANSVEDDYRIKEYIYAGYGMGSVRFGALTLLGGVRWEKTSATIRAVEVRNAGSTLLGRFPTSGTADYDKFFPNIQATYRFTDRLQLRAAVTETIGRPAYEDARPLSNFRYDPLGAAAVSPAFPYSGTLSIGNPQLGPYDAMNYDLSLEWYLQNSGVISVAAFRKDIDDPIYTYSETQRNVTHSGIALETLSLTGKRNADRGRISGLEFNVYQPLKFLPSPFDGFGIDANLTTITSSEAIPTRPGEDIPFFRQPARIANATLFYEKYGFMARVAWTYSGRQIYTLGSNLLNDIYRRPREQVDVQVRYRFNPRYAITASVRNLTREPEQFTYGFDALMRTSRLLDRDYKVGLDFNF